jgi:hypothetical protein
MMFFLSSKLQFFSFPFDTLISCNYEKLLT